MTDDLAALFAYNRWADARVLEACRPVPPERYGAELAPGWASLGATLFHIAAATDLWARRFLGEPSAGFPDEAGFRTPDDVAGLLAAAHDKLDRLVDGLSPEQQSAPFTYRNLRGQAATVPLWAALRHVVNHASYHRGQVASKLRRLGIEPPVTDFIYWVIERTTQPPG